MRQIKRYSQTFLSGLLGLALLVGLNILAAKQAWRVDVTSNKRYSLSAESEKALKNLSTPVTAAAFYRPQDDSKSVAEDLFKLFGQRTPNFSYEFLDPDRTPFRAKEMGVTQIGTVVVTAGDKTEKVVFPTEEKLLNAVIRVSDPHRALLYVVTGHGELDPAGTDEASSCAKLKAALTNQGVDMETLTLARQTAVPENASALLILGPRRDFLPQELATLTRYFEAGGRLFIGISAEEHTNLDAWVDEHLGLTRMNGLVVDPMSKLVVGDPLIPLIQTYGPHEITRDFTMMTLLPTCTAFSASEKGPASNAFYLGQSTDQSWLETDMAGLRAGTAEFDEKDVSGPLWLAAGYQAQAEGNATKPVARAVLFADQDFLSDRYLNLAGNLDFARNSANWLMERAGLITVSKPTTAGAFLLLDPTQRLILTWVPLLLIPGVMLALAIVVARRRRRARTVGHA